MPAALLCNLAWATLALALLCVVLPPAHADADIEKRGLVLWLDASDQGSLALDATGRVKSWKDLSGAGHDAFAVAGSEPLRAEGALSGKPAVRFEGAQALVVPAIRKDPGPAMVFIVSQRTESQAGQTDWQRLLSITAPGNDRDNKPPGLALIEPANGKPIVYGPIVRELSFGQLSLSDLHIGRSSANSVQGFRGDIAEVLVYDRPFFSEEAIGNVVEYLAAKWNATPTRKTEGWTRSGPLGETPAHTRDDLPLSDQQNRGNWVPVPEASDEFDGPCLDALKWTPAMWYWKGRPPAYFNPANVTVQDGCLCLTMRKQQLPAMDEDKQYHDYTSCIVISTRRFGYGYYEVRAKPMDSAGSSSFWFQSTGVPGYNTEIDVFELGGKAPGFEHKVNMNLHIDKKDTVAKYSTGGVWEAPFRLADDFHVYGLEWSPRELVYYVDGVAVRRIENRDCHKPLLIIFDSETMPDWFGMPRDEDLPSTFRVDYIRAWRNGAEGAGGQ